MSSPQSTPPADDRTRVIHRGLKFDLVARPVPTRSGTCIDREYVRHPGAVTIVALDDDNRILFVRQHRVSLDRATIELPAGTMTPGESAEACADRELREETGFEAATLQPAGRFHPSPGLSDELMHVFVATDLRFVGQALEDDESIEVLRMTPSEVGMAIRSGELDDGKSIAALVRALPFDTRLAAVFGVEATP